MTRDKFNCYFSFWAIFCPFTPLRAWKIKFQKKWEKLLEISSFYTSVPKLMTIYFPVPEICHVADIIIFHFGQFFALPPPPPNNSKNENFKKKNERNVWRYHFLTQLYQKSWSYVILFLRYSTWQMQLLFFSLGYFLHFYPTNSAKNENFKKNEKSMWRDHHFPHVYDFLMYCSWYMVCNRKSDI